MRRARRLLAIAALAVAVVTCVDSPTSPTSHTAKSNGARASLAFAPVFTTADKQAAAVFDENGFLVNSVRVVVILPPSDTLADTTVAASATDSSFSLDLSVNVDPGAQLTLALEYLSGSTILYSGGGTITALPVSETTAPTATPISVVAVGPGARATQVTLSPASGTFSTASPIQIAATAFDASNTPIPNAILGWSVDDQTVATITNSGQLQPTGKRGTVHVTATALSGVAGQATLTLLPPPSKVVVVSGGAQTGGAGQPLTLPLVVQVQAADGGPVPGQTVTFSASGGTAPTVNPTTATSDSLGHAQTIMTIGTTPATYTYTATVGTLTASVTATGTAGPPSAISIVSGNGQADTVKQTFPAPLVVKVVDKFGNPTGGITVTWARTAGAGSTSANTTTTAADGTTSVTYSLGATSGTETVTASVTGVLQPATFTLTALGGKASTIVVVSGDAQQGSTGQPLASPLIARVVDGSGNGVAGVHVTWTVPTTNATITLSQSTSDANGQVAATVTLGSSGGPVTISVALDAGPNVQFHLTAISSVGAPTKLRFIVQPSAALSGATIAPPIQVAVVDSNNNIVTSVSPTAINVALTTSWGATLSGPRGLVTSAGVATFSGLSVDRAGTYTLTATAEGYTSGVSTPFTITAGVASAIKLTNGPSNDSLSFTAGSPPESPPTVTVVDGGNNVIPNSLVHFAVAVTVSLSHPSVHDTTYEFQDDTISTGSTGVSLVPPQLVNHAGRFTITLSAVGGSVSTVPPPQTVIITAGPATYYVLTASTLTPFTSTTDTVRAQVVDAFGNPVSVYHRTVNWFLNPSEGDGTLSSSTSSTDSHGVAKICYTAPFSVSGPVTVSVIGGEVDTGSVVLTPRQGAASMTFVTTPPPSAQEGIAWSQQPKIQLLDGGGHPIAEPGVTVSVSASSEEDAVEDSVNQSGTSVITDANGVATFSNLLIVGPTGTFPLIFTSPALGELSIQSTITLNAGPPAFAGTSDGPTVQTANSDVNVFTANDSIFVVDGDGNPVPGITVTWTLNAPCAASTFPSLQSSTTVTSSSGSAPAPLININGGNPGSCILAGSVPVLGSNFFPIIVQPNDGNLNTWLGFSTDWNDGNNWSFGISPDEDEEEESVFIPAAASSQPLFGSGDNYTEISDLFTETGSTLNLNRDTIEVDNSALVSGSVTNGDVDLFGNTAQGSFAGLLVEQESNTFFSGNVTVQDTLDLFGTVQLDSGTTITIGGTSAALARFWESTDVSFDNTENPITSGTLIGLTTSNCQYSPFIFDVRLDTIINSRCTSNDQLDNEEGRPGVAKARVKRPRVAGKLVAHPSATNRTFPLPQALRKKPPHRGKALEQDFFAPELFRPDLLLRPAFGQPPQSP